MSPREYSAAINGYIISKGGNRNKPVLKDEMKDLMRRFPD